jgi:hypothetical protein
LRIEHNKVKPYWLGVLLIVTFGTGRAPQPCPRPLWTEDLVRGYQYRDFNLAKHSRNQSPPLWSREQGVVFISSSALAVYQVLERDDLPHLQPRDESGGGGRYLLQTVLFDAAQGKSLGTIRLATSGVEPSGVYPTHDGSFVVKTGNSLRLYSSKLEQIAFRLLPRPDSDRPQSPIISVSPSGQQVYVGYRPSAERDVLDADTLELLPNSQRGDWDAEANPKAPKFVAKDTSCPWGYEKLTPKYFVGYGCKELKIISSDGELLWDIPESEQVVRVLGNETRLVAELQHRRANPLDLDLVAKPLGLIIYDLTTRTESCRIPAQFKLPAEESRSIYFALSKTGGIAVVQQNALSFYYP